jgi:hypothetical protein
MTTPPGKEITWGELHVGSRQVFADADFTEVSQSAGAALRSRAGAREVRHLWTPHAAPALSGS